MAHHTPIPMQQKVLSLEAKGGPLVVKQAEVPRPGPNEVLIRIEAAALSPGDWRIYALGKLVRSYPAIHGFDAAGVVTEVGSEVKDHATGDRVMCESYYDVATGELRGAFQQHIAVPSVYVAKIPENLAFEEAATIPSSFGTAALPLYNDAEGASSARLLAPWEEGGKGKYTGKAALILGGASSVGQYVIQLARLSGFSTIVTTASLGNADFLKSLGATHVLDRQLPSEKLVHDACGVAGGPFDLVYDAVANEETLAAGYRATACESDFVYVLPNPIPGADESSKKRLHFANGLYTAPVNQAAGRRMLAKLPGLLERGDIKPNRPEVLPGGLDGVLAGLERLGRNQVSGVKLVVRPQETE
ncbi:GroES-like protein [Trametes sanguinea]|nr:GroES-like protein [Trametes sanguinea]